MKKYIPSPIDTSDIHLPEGLTPLIESLAKNVHEIWAKERMNKAGPMVKSEMMRRRIILVLSHTRTCQKRRKSTTETLLSRP